MLATLPQQGTDGEVKRFAQHAGLIVGYLNTGALE